MAPNLDCMPISVLESFASGLPVVATRAGGVPHLIADETTGLLVELGDHEAMAAAAIRLLEDEELAASIARNARAECARYTADAVRADWLALYQEVAAERRAEHAKANLG
jgi:glycosyltransferase involved in cell wall biosynthesis